MVSRLEIADIRAFDNWHEVDQGAYSPGADHGSETRQWNRRRGWDEIRRMAVSVRSAEDDVAEESGGRKFGQHLHKSQCRLCDSQV
jgi:hypothetical protein